MSFWGELANPYSDLLKEGRSHPSFNAALCPPVLTSLFDVGTLFTYNDDKSIRTYVPIPPI